jgi:NADH dehydrogenase [ubiquinone] 1 alpha subcomplex assembly factor 1
MKTITLLLVMVMTNQSMTLFNFNKTSNINHWHVVDDVVMGGVSSGTFSINEIGNGVFKGAVSLENNGGFSSVRYRFKEISTKEYSKIVLRVKGDGKNYQFRVKEKSSDSHYYITTFHTTKEWKTIRIPLSQLFPSFRGRKLDKPNFDKETIAEIAFLIANKKAEKFNLEIDYILLE